MSSNFKSVTIVDVAQAANVSIATTSRVLSGSNYPVSAATRDKVLKAAEALGYSPNLLGHMLRTRSNRTIAVIIPSFHNPFYTQLIMGIEQAACQAQYSINFLSSMRDPAQERKLIRQMLDMRIPGLMLTSIDTNPDMLNEYMKAGGVACVFEANYALNLDLINASVDFHAAGRLATEYLIGLGHRSIALFSAPLSKHSRHEVLNGYQSSLESHGLPFSTDNIFIAPFERDLDDGLYEYEIGIALANMMIESGRKYTAIVAANDLIACGVICGLNRHGIRIPEDISLVGLDNIPQSMIVSPALTTVDQFATKLGQTACQALVEHLDGSASSACAQLSIHPELVIRDSTRAIVCNGSKRS